MSGAPAVSGAACGPPVLASSAVPAAEWNDCPSSDHTSRCGEPTVAAVPAAAIPAVSSVWPGGAWACAGILGAPSGFSPLHGSWVCMPRRKGVPHRTVATRRPHFPVVPAAVPVGQATPPSAQPSSIGASGPASHSPPTIYACAESFLPGHLTVMPIHSGPFLPNSRGAWCRAGGGVRQPSFWRRQDVYLPELLYP